MELTKERMLDIAKAFQWNAKNVEINCSKCGETIMQHSEEEIAFYEKIAELLQADADGRCVVLPCKIGDSAWAITNYYGKKKPKEGIISEIYFTKDMRIAVALKGIARGEIGKNIFLTKEEALAELHEQWEKALEGGVAE